jgi:hypothetical protein
VVRRCGFGDGVNGCGRVSGGGMWVGVFGFGGGVCEYRGGW